MHSGRKIKTMVEANQMKEEGGNQPSEDPDDQIKKKKTLLGETSI